MDDELELRYRRPELHDAEALYLQKNDPIVVRTLGGFSHGYSRPEIEQWIRRVQTASSDVIFSICVPVDECIGHLGFYEIDHRVRSAEFGIMVGAKDYWGRGIGGRSVRWALNYGFAELALHRIRLSVLASHESAIRLYLSSGFTIEGRHRHVQWRDGKWIDSLSMGILEDDWRCGAG